MASAGAQAPGGAWALAVRANACVFFVAGLGLASWAPLVPFAKLRAGLDEGQLGLLLVAVGVGSLVAMPAAGRLLARWGARRILAWASGALMLAILGLATLSHFAGLALALLAYGAALGFLDVAMNTQAVALEREGGRAIMSRLHALFSFGCIVGGGGLTALLALGLSPWWAASAGCAVLLGGVALAWPHFLDRVASSGPAAGFAWPRGVVLLVGLMACAMFGAEGAMLDWSAVHLSSRHGLDPAWAGVGYAAFAVCTTTGRLLGDAVVTRLGGWRVVLLGALLGAVGLAWTAWAPSWPWAVAGCALVGAGVANVVPVLFSSLGKQSEMPEAQAVPWLTTLGYAGVMAGPAALGAVAKASSLPWALTGLAALLVGVSLAGLRLRRLGL